MALFRPYEQGKRETDDDARPRQGGATAVPASGRPRSTGATAVGARRPDHQAEDAVASTTGMVETSPVEPTAVEASAIETSAVEASPANDDRTARQREKHATGRPAPRTKQGPTRSRKEAEAERMARLHPTLSKKEQRAQNRVQGREERVHRMDTLENSPGRVLARDYIDSRWTLVEFIIPLYLVMMILLLVGAFLGPTIAQVMQIVVFVAFGLAVINMFLLWRGFKRELAARHPGTPTRGLLSYMINRGMWIRRFRRPAPRVARGEKY